MPRLLQQPCRQDAAKSFQAENREGIAVVGELNLEESTPEQFLALAGSALAVTRQEIAGTESITIFGLDWIQTSTLLQFLYKPAATEGPVRTCKFKVKIGNSAGRSFEEVGIMYVTGLRTNAAEVVLTRAAAPGGSSQLLDWRLNPRKRMVVITVAEVVEFTLQAAQPVFMRYSDLDAGANELLLEQLTVQYERMDVRYLA